MREGGRERQGQCGKEKLREDVLATMVQALWAEEAREKLYSLAGLRCLDVGESWRLDPKFARGCLYCPCKLP